MDDLLIRTRDLFAELTRYPLEVLDPDADLEEELGIDSVKRAEILVAFRERFGIPETLDVQPGDLRSIRSVAAVVQRHMTAPTGAVEAAEPSGRIEARALVGQALPSTAPPEGSPSPRRHASVSPGLDVGATVIETIAAVMRYPRELLVPEADLEDDLGIDPLTLQQIVAALAERLPLDGRPGPGAGVRTIGDLVSAVRAQLSPHVSEVANAAVVAPAPQARPAVDLLRATDARPFEGKIAFITGSGHGIGRVMALQLAALGARVIVNSFHSRDRGEQTTEDIRREGGDAVHLWGSVAKPDHLERMFADIERQFGRLDFFISNASNGVFARLEDITPEHWDRSFRTNVVAFHQGAILASRLMRPSGGKIVALSSPGAQRYIEYFGCLGPIKAAVESLVRYLSVELASSNIQVNAVSMGPIYGELLNKYPEKERLIPYWESLSMDRRLGDESDISNVVMHLLSPLTDRITGTVTLIDIGGSQRI